MLILGPLVLDAFETPERLTFGGRQRLAAHALPDGTRIVDALGRDEAPLRWHGVFSGPDAPVRARALDLLRAQGGAWPLSWDAFSYLVVIERLRLMFERPNWVPYEISCCVIADESAALVAAVVDVAAAVASDLTMATALGFDAGSAQAVLSAAMPGDVAGAIAATGAMAQAAAARGYAQRAAINNATSGG